MRWNSSVLVAALALAMPTAQAAITITIVESGSDVVATMSGDIDIGVLTPSLTGTAALPIIYYASPTDYSYGVGAGGGAAVDVYPVTFTTAEPLNTLAVNEVADSSTGSYVGVQALGGDELLVPAGYGSGLLSGTATWSGQTLASLGLTPGSYVFEYNVPGATTDSVTFEVVAPTVIPPPVTTTPAKPIPALPLYWLAFTALGLGYIARRRFRGQKGR